MIMLQNSLILSPMMKTNLSNELTSLQPHCGIPLIDQEMKNQVPDEKLEISPSTTLSCSNTTVLPLFKITISNARLQSKIFDQEKKIFFFQSELKHLIATRNNLGIVDSERKLIVKDTNDALASLHANCAQTSTSKLQKTLLENERLHTVYSQNVELISQLEKQINELKEKVAQKPIMIECIKLTHTRQARLANMKTESPTLDLKTKVFQLNEDVKRILGVSVKNEKKDSVLNSAFEQAKFNLTSLTARVVTEREKLGTKNVSTDLSTSTSNSNTSEFDEAKTRLTKLRTDTKSRIDIIRRFLKKNLEKKSGSAELILHHDGTTNDLKPAFCCDEKASSLANIKTKSPTLDLKTKVFQLNEDVKRILGVSVKSEKKDSVFNSAFEQAKFNLTSLTARVVTKREKMGTKNVSTDVSTSTSNSNTSDFDEAKNTLTKLRTGTKSRIDIIQRFLNRNLEKKSGSAADRLELIVHHDGTANDLKPAFCCEEKASSLEQVELENVQLESKNVDLKDKVFTLCKERKRMISDLDFLKKENELHIQCLNVSTMLRDAKIFHFDGSNGPQERNLDDNTSSKEAALKEETIFQNNQVSPSSEKAETLLEYTEEEIQKLEKSLTEATEKDDIVKQNISKIEEIIIKNAKLELENMDLETHVFQLCKEQKRMLADFKDLKMETNLQTECLKTSKMMTDVHVYFAKTSVMDTLNPWEDSTVLPIHYLKSSKHPKLPIPSTEISYDKFTYLNGLPMRYLTESRHPRLTITTDKDIFEYETKLTALSTLPSRYLTPSSHQKLTSQTHLIGKNETDVSEDFLQYLVSNYESNLLQTNIDEDFNGSGKVASYDGDEQNKFVCDGEGGRLLM